MDGQIEIVFLGMEHDEALAGKVRKKCRRFARFDHYITGIRIVLEKTKDHYHQGSQCHVTVEIVVRGQQLVVNHAQGQKSRIEGFAPAIYETFRAMAGQLESYVKRRHGAVKHHDDTRLPERPA